MPQALFRVAAHDREEQVHLTARIASVAAGRLDEEQAVGNSSAVRSAWPHCYRACHPGSHSASDPQTSLQVSTTLKELRTRLQAAPSASPSLVQVGA